MPLTKEKEEFISKLLEEMSDEHPNPHDVREILMYAFAASLGLGPPVNEMEWGRYGFRISRMLHLADNMAIAVSMRKHDIEFGEFLAWKRNKD